MLEVPFRPRARAGALSLYGAAGLTLAAVVHVGSYLGHTISPEHPLFRGLHAGVFPLFFAFAFRLRAWQRTRRGMFGFRQAQLRWRELSAYLPVWVPPLLVLLFAYVMVNFFLATAHLAPRGASGTPSVADGLYTVRAFSGHWLLFYTLPPLFFAFVPADARPAPSPQDAAA